MAPSDSQQILLFTLDEPRYALELAVVERVVQAVEVMPLPKAPPLVVGVINVQGQVIPVVDIRARFNLPPREIHVDDQFILARTLKQRVALVTDAVNGIRHLTDDEQVAADEVMPGTGYIHGVAKLDDQLVLICDLDQILPFNLLEALELTEAASEAAGDGQ